MVDSRTNPMDVDQVGDDTVDAERRGQQAPLKMDEGGTPPLPGSLDVMDPATSPTESHQTDPELDTNPNGDPGQLSGSRDPDAANSRENDGRPESQGGDTPYDAQGTAGSEGG